MARRTKPYLLRASFRPGAQLNRDEYPFNIPAARELTEHYAVTRDFLNNYPRRLEQLLADEGDA